MLLMVPLYLLFIHTTGMAHFRLIIKFSASSWLILRNKYIEMHGQQNIKIFNKCYISLFLYKSYHFLLKTNMTGNVHTNITLRRVCVTAVAVEKQ